MLHSVYEDVLKDYVLTEIFEIEATGLEVFVSFESIEI